MGEHTEGPLSAATRVAHTSDVWSKAVRDPCGCPLALKPWAVLFDSHRCHLELNHLGQGLRDSQKGSVTFEERYKDWNKVWLGP